MVASLRAYHGRRVGGCLFRRPCPAELSSWLAPAQSSTVLCLPAYGGSPFSSTESSPFRPTIAATLHRRAGRERITIPSGRSFRAPLANVAFSLSRASGDRLRRDVGRSLSDADGCPFRAASQDRCATGSRSGGRTEPGTSLLNRPP
jgi:hypothetical protein